MTESGECGQPVEEMDTENVDDTTEYVIYAPSCLEIPEDKNLKYSNPSFKERIQAVKETSSDNIHLFPQPHIFAHFSIIAYQNDPTIDADLAPGWEVLTTATNTRTWSQAILRKAPNNGYFGVAFLHPENHQVIIAHRGTDKKCIAAIKTDYYGVIHNEYVWQIFSAATFALEVVQALRNQNIDFQLFFTGHSLGGWLAQITTFTIKYLRVAETCSAGTIISCFHRLTPKNINSERSTSVHAHTVVFDSPGCKPMLLKLTDGFDVRYSGKMVQVNELDITSYMSAPNWVNTRNAHVGKLYRLYFEINVEIENVGYSWINVFAKFQELYEKWNHTNAAHDKEKFLEVLLLRENARIREVVDWPESIGISGGKEIDGYLKWAAEHNIFIPPLKHSYSNELPGCYTIRYQVKVPEKNKRNLNVFTQNQRDFLEKYQLVRTFQDESESDLSEEHRNLLSDYKIDNLNIESSVSGRINQLAAGVSSILRKYENLPKQIKEKLTPAGVATFNYLKSIQQSNYNFNSNPEIVATILESKNKAIWELTAADTTAAFIRFVDGLKKSLQKSDVIWRFTALSFEKLMQLIDDETDFNEGHHHHLVIVNCGNLDDDRRNKIKDFMAQIKNNAKIKLILISLSKSGWTKNDIISAWEWKDLSTDTKRLIMGKRIILQGKHVGLSNILFDVGRPESLSENDLNLDFECKLKQGDIMRLMTSESLTVSVGRDPPRISELEAAFVRCGNVITDRDNVIKFIKDCKEEDVAFLFSIVTSSSSSSSLLESIERNKNVYTNDVELIGRNFVEENEPHFKQFCKENKIRSAYWLSLIADKWKLEMIFDANFFVDRSIRRVAVKKCVRDNINEFKFLDFPSTETIRSRLNVSEKDLSDETIQTQMISRDLPFEDSDTKNILMTSEAFPNDFVPREKVDQNKLNVFCGESIFVVVDEPGMGKSTILVQLGEAEYESHWVVHISLKNCNRKEKETTGQNLQTFIWSHGCRNENDLEKALFHFRLQHIKRVDQPFLFLLDGYDEIQTTTSQENVTAFLQELYKKIANTNHRMVVTTRRHPELEKTLEVPFTLQFLGFDSPQQKAYFKNAWERRAQLLVKSWDNKKSNQFISDLLKKAGAVLSRQGTQFISIPLQLRLMSVAFFENYVNYLRSDQTPESDVLQDFTLGKLYKDFVAAKYEIYRNEKVTMIMNESNDKRDKDAWKDGHKSLAISAIGTHRYIRRGPDLSEELINELYRIGIVVKGYKESGGFVHQTFAEFFAAAYICENIVNKELKSDSTIPHKMLIDALINYNLKLIFVFLDYFLGMCSNIEMLPKFTVEEKRKIIEYYCDCASPRRSEYDSYKERDMRFTGMEGRYSNATEPDECKTRGLDLQTEHYIQAIITVACIENLANVLKLIFILNGGNLPTHINIGDVICELNISGKIRSRSDIVTPLHIAAICGSLSVVKYLVTEIGVNTTEWDKKRNSALDLAAENNHLETVKFLLTQNIHLNKGSNYGSPIHAAAFHGHLEVVKELLKHKQFNNVELLNCNNETPLHKAVYNGHMGIVQFFIEEGADISVKDFYDRTLIHRANERHHEDVLKYILAENASREGTNKPRIVGGAVSKDGKTALHYAAFSKRIGCLKVLLEAEICHIDRPDNSGETALHIAAKQRNLEAVKCLIGYGAKVDILNKHTPLYSLLLKIRKNLSEAKCDCCYWNHDELVEVLKFLKEKIPMGTDKIHFKPSSHQCPNCKKILASVRKLFLDNEVVD